MEVLLKAGTTKRKCIRLLCNHARIIMHQKLKTSTEFSKTLIQLGYVKGAHKYHCHTLHILYALHC